jgi:hypothetical protein
MGVRGGAERRYFNTLMTRRKAFPEMKGGK